MTIYSKLVSVALIVFSAGCGSSASNGQYTTEVAFPNLNFTRPVDLQDPGDGSDRLFVVEQAGVIRVFANDRSASSAEVFLDIRDRVDDAGNEEGLLGLAFHPDFESNGIFYVDYTATNPDRTVISRFSVSAGDPDVADSDSETVILTVPQPFGNHNGGQIAFGPDRMLYIALGDGGSGGDPQGNGQNPGTLLGSILRIDVDNVTGDLGYGIPEDNPFAGSQGSSRPEIFAYGLRNPWRFSFDSDTGKMWAGDVGQNRFEEIDVVESGKNYGWNVMEGFECYNASSCDQTGLELPVHTYPRDSGVSVTGGYVYRGSRLPGIVGSYVYGDFGSGRIWSLTREAEGYRNELLVDTDLGVASFGTDSSEELYICAFDGRIHRLVDISDTSSEMPTGAVGTYPIDVYPNPFTDVTTVAFDLGRPGRVLVTVYDAVGREVVSLLDRYLGQGDHTVSWDVRAGTRLRVAPGFYYLVVRHKESVRTAPVVVGPGY